MDQLHEELKQPVPSLTEDSLSSDSDEDEPNHHNKRLLGGTSLLHDGNLRDGIIALEIEAAIFGVPTFKNF